MSRIITRDAIVEAAIAIGDEKGLERVSMRAVAGRLGVQAMSLYHHVRNKAELLDAIHEHLILELTLPSESPTWEAALRSAAGAYRALALRHPNLFVLVATRPISTPAEIAHIAPALTVFDEAGIPPEQQLFSVQSFFCALNGYLLAEVAPTPGHAEVPDSPIPVPPEGAPSVLTLLASLDGQQPSGTAGENFLAASFDAFVDVFLTGLAERLGEP